MKERFEGDNRPVLLNLLGRQFGGGQPAIAEQIATLGDLVEYGPAQQLILEGGEDNDVAPSRCPAGTRSLLDEALSLGL